MEISEILSELERNRGHFPGKAVEEAVRRKDEIAPFLLEAVEKAIARARAEDIDHAVLLHVYALYLLAQFRDTRAYPLAVELCRLPGEKADMLLGETIADGIDRILASVCGGDIAPIQSIVEDPAADEYARGSALHALSILVYQDALSSADVIAYLTELFRGKLERTHSHVWGALIADTMDLGVKSLESDIQAAFEEGLPDTGFITPRDVSKAFKKSEEAILAQSKKECRGLIDDAVEEMAWWHCFGGEEDEDGGDEEDLEVEAPLRVVGPEVKPGPSIGRNSPCPCGSGKKYKKCCGAGDAGGWVSE
jgi:hypothetical protein